MAGDLIAGGTGSVASPNEVAILFTEFPEAFDQYFPVAFCVNGFFFDFVCNELHDVIVQELDAVKVSATKAKDFKTCDRSTPRKKVGSGSELGPFTENHDIGFLQNFFGVCGGMHEWEYGEIEGALRLGEQPYEILIRPGRGLGGSWIWLRTCHVPCPEAKRKPGPAEGPGFR